MAEPSPALVHDYLLTLRGAERAFAGLASCWPRAPIYTLVHDAPGVDGRFAGRDVRVSGLQRLGVRQSNFRRLLPAYPYAVRRLPVREHALVLSSTSAWAHGVRCAPDAVHIAWCHIPFRYAWSPADARRAAPLLLRPAAGLAASVLRRSDAAAASRVTHYLANCRLTQRRIEECYGRSADVVHPPVDVERFRPGTPEDFFLVVGELVPHKRTALAVRAARRAGVRLIIVGDGPERARLEAMAGPAARFAGRVDDAEVARLHARARALVVPNVEDFGIVAVEAHAAGRPVLGVSAGGCLEIVVPGETGVLVPAGDVDALAEAMRHVDFDRFNPAAAVRRAQRFSLRRFRLAYTRAVLRLTADASAEVRSAARLALAADLGQATAERRATPAARGPRDAGPQGGELVAPSP